MTEAVVKVETTDCETEDVTNKEVEVTDVIKQDGASDPDPCDVEETSAGYNIETVFIKVEQETMDVESDDNRQWTDGNLFEQFNTSDNAGITAAFNLHDQDINAIAPPHWLLDCGPEEQRDTTFPYYEASKKLRKERRQKAPSIGPDANNDLELIKNDPGVDLSQFQAKGIYSKKIPASMRPKRFKCELCPSRFLYHSGLITHLRSHTGEKPFECVYCGFRCTRKSILKEHEFTHSGEKPHSCSECGRSFTTKSEVRQHEKIHSGVKPFVCDTCGHAFVHRRSLIDHLAMHDSRKHDPRCDHCDFRCLDKVDLVAHLKIHESVVMPYKCSSCEFQSADEQALVVHVKAKHSRVKKQWFCDRCDFKALNQKLLKQHHASHAEASSEVKDQQDQRLYKCPHCFSTFPNSDELLTHRRTHKAEAKPFACTQCEYSSYKHMYLKNHMKCHYGTQIHHCHECDYCCTLSKNLRKHLKKHAQPAAFPCPECDLKLRSSKELERHIKSHNETKKFKCSLCAFRSTRSGHLVLHMRVHTGERPYNCEFCDYTCKRKGNLTRHQKLYGHSRDSLGAIPADQRENKKVGCHVPLLVPKVEEIISVNTGLVSES